MTKTRGFSYAVVLAAAFVLWLPVSLFGTQGFSGLLGLAAIPAAFFAPLSRFSRVFLALMALSLWAALSSLWSAESGMLVAGAMTDGNFSIDAAGIRVLLTTLAAGLMISAALRIETGSAPKAMWVMLGVLVAHGLLTLAMGLLPGVTLDAYAPFSDRVHEAPQNILRSANAFLLGLPVLLGAIWAFAGKARSVWIAGTLLVSLVAFYLVGSDVALLGVFAVAASIGVTCVARRQGFRILLICVAVFTTLSPLILGVGGALVSKAGMPLPSSVQSRVWAWQLTTDKIVERPVIGHGIEASKEWRETFGDNPELLEQMIEQTGIDDGRWSYYRILPGHPHNMALQLWAEIGGIGVLLAVLSLVLIAWKLPPPAELQQSTAIATASLIGAGFSLFSLSYSVWNEAFWATLAIAAAGIILLAKTTAKP